MKFPSFGPRLSHLRTSSEKYSVDKILKLDSRYTTDNENETDNENNDNDNDNYKKNDGSVTPLEQTPEPPLLELMQTMDGNLSNNTNTKKLETSIISVSC